MVHFFLQIWYYNVPHTKLAKVKGHQNWVKISGEYLTFPGGGTQFKHGALHYIDFINEVIMHDISCLLKAELFICYPHFLLSVLHQLLIIFFHLILFLYFLLLLCISYASLTKRPF